MNFIQKLILKVLVITMVYFGLSYLLLQAFEVPIWGDPRQITIKVLISIIVGKLLYNLMFEE